MSHHDDGDQADEEGATGSVGSLPIATVVDLFPVVTEALKLIAEKLDNWSHDFVVLKATDLWRRLGSRHLQTSQGEPERPDRARDQGHPGLASYAW